MNDKLQALLIDLQTARIKADFAKADRDEFLKGQRATDLKAVVTKADKAVKDLEEQTRALGHNILSSGEELEFGLTLRNYKPVMGYKYEQKEAYLWCRENSPASLGVIQKKFESLLDDNDLPEFVSIREVAPARGVIIIPTKLEKVL